MNRALAAAALLLLPALALADSDPPQIKHTPVAQAKTGEQIRITCELTDESEIFQPLVYWRAQGAASYANVPLRQVEGSKYEAVLGGSASAGVIEYFIETFDEMGNGPARVGSEDRPMKINIVSPNPTASAASAPRAAPAASGRGTSGSATPGRPPPPPVPTAAIAVSGGGPLYAHGGILLDRTWTWVAAGGAGAMVLLGALLGASALGAAADYKRLMADLPPAGLDPARVRAAYDGANGLAAASTTFWVLSAISAVGAGVLFVLEAPPGAFQFTPSEPAPPPDAISLQVAPAPGGASVSLLARF